VRALTAEGQVTVEEAEIERCVKQASQEYERVRDEVKINKRIPGRRKMKEEELNPAENGEQSTFTTEQRQESVAGEKETRRNMPLLMEAEAVEDLMPITNKVAIAKYNIRARARAHVDQLPSPKNAAEREIT
jgi:hypothetical protein